MEYKLLEKEDLELMKEIIEDDDIEFDLEKINEFYNDKNVIGFIAGVLQLNNINFFETLDIALFFCQFFCIFYSYFLVLCDIIVSGGVSYG